jgi:HK97 family phage major capsid protein
MDLSEISRLIEAQKAAFEAFKKTNDERIDKLTKGEGVAEITAKLERIFNDVQAQKALLEEIEAKAKRPGFGGNPSDADVNVANHKTAFNSYMRKGRDAGLADLEAKALDISVGSDGGFAVPKVVEQSIESLVVNISPVRSIVTVQQIGTSDFHKLVNLRGTASGWVGEQAARPATGTPTLADVAPPMGELYANPQATQQMLDDVQFNAEAWLAAEVATEFARAEGAAFVAGSGVNQPKGFLSYTSVATGDATRAFGQLEFVGTGVSGAFPAANPGDILFTLVSKLKAAYRQNASWVTNKDALFKIAQFKDSGGRYIFNPVSAPGVPQTLLNYPVTEAEDMPALGANSLSVAFGDFKRGYLVVDRIGTRVLRDPLTNKPYIGFYTTKRVGGGVVNSEAIKLLKFI